MRQEVYVKFAEAIRAGRAVKAAEARRAVIHTKFAEALEKRANGRMVLKGLNHVMNALRAGSRALPATEGTLRALNPTLLQSLSRTGLSLRKFLSPKVDLPSLGKYDLRRILSTSRITPPTGAAVPDYVPETGAVVPAREILRRLGWGSQTTRISPAKALAAGAGAAAAGTVVGKAVSDPKADVTQAQAVSNDRVAQLQQLLDQWRQQASAK